MIEVGIEARGRITIFELPLVNEVLQRIDVRCGDIRVVGPVEIGVENRAEGCFGRLGRLGRAAGRSRQ